MSAISKDNNNDYGMSPSIMSTIRNTSPSRINPNNDDIIKEENSTNTNSRRAETFCESYIEDSFVGHWETEEDDPPKEGDCNTSRDSYQPPEEEDSTLHPSTIEFAFDSIGPESFIYVPAVEPNNQQEKLGHSGDDHISTTETIAIDQVTTQQHIQPTLTDSPNLQQTPNGQHYFTNDMVIPMNRVVDNVQIDLKVIEPYKKVISHAGYCHHNDPNIPPPIAGEAAPAVIVFSACYLPDRSRRDYDYVMDHLFLYVLSSLHDLIADDYILIYLHNPQSSKLTGSISSYTSSSSSLSNVNSSSSLSQEELANRNNLPTFTWIKRCYQMIDRKLRKNLKILYLVRPTFWLKTIIMMCRPFISSKFSKKLRLVENMDGLRKLLPVDKLILPASSENL